MRKIFFFCIAVLAVNISQSQSQDSIQSNNAIAKELANPNTALGTMALQFDYLSYKGNLPDAGSQNGLTLNFQPSLPIPLSNGINLFVRPNIPILISQPIYGVNGFEQKSFNLGNISADVAVGKTWPSKTITIVGAFAGFPTASDKSLRSSEVSLGPEFMVAQLFSWGALGVMVNHSWGISGTPNEDGSSNEFSILSNVPRHASITAGQYFYVINLKNAWQITGQPTWSYNHDAEKGSRLTFPIATGANKVVRFGKLPLKISLQYWYYIAANESFGPQHQIRLSIAPVIPLPW